MKTKLLKSAMIASLGFTDAQPLSPVSIKPSVCNAELSETNNIKQPDRNLNDNFMFMDDASKIKILEESIKSGNFHPRFLRPNELRPDLVDTQSIEGGYIGVGPPIRTLSMAPQRSSYIIQLDANPYSILSSIVINRIIELSPDRQTCSNILDTIYDSPISYSSIKNVVGDKIPLDDHLVKAFDNYLIKGLRIASKQNPPLLSEECGFKNSFIQDDNEFRRIKDLIQSGNVFTSFVDLNNHEDVSSLIDNLNNFDKVPGLLDISNAWWKRFTGSSNALCTLIKNLPRNCHIMTTDRIKEKTSQENSQCSPSEWWYKQRAAHKIISDKEIPSCKQDLN